MSYNVSLRITFDFIKAVRMIGLARMAIRHQSDDSHK